jgi:hypothetical protein
MRDNLTQEEQIIYDILIASRDVQNYIWGLDNLMFDGDFDPKIWAFIFEKRVNKIKEINTLNPNSRIELRKRVLQQAALSVLALKLLDDNI